jgi:ATP-dependent Clp protease ATP-binding subunit ClpA
MRRASCFSAPHRRPSTAYEESRDLESSYVGPEHVLLALARDTETAAGDLLERFGVSHTKLRGAVIRGVEVGGPRARPRRHRSWTSSVT